jgi:hypothetical protein
MDLRIRSKRGLALTPEEHGACARAALEDYPEWYRATSTDVFFAAAAAIGSSIRRPEK